MERRKRRQYTKEFKIESVELSKRSNKTVLEIAGDLGIRPELLYRWRTEYFSFRENSFPGSGKLSNHEDEKSRKLERELKSVQEERDILKKALAIFSKAPR
jgi:transposase